MAEQDFHDNHSEDTPMKPKNNIFLVVWEALKVVIISLAIILPIRYYLVQPFFVKGASMESSFDDGDYLLIDEISYRFKDPARGDVIIFRYPEDPSQFFIKRIIGLPGESVEILNDKVKIYNERYPDGFYLKEDYLDGHQRTLGSSKVKLGDKEFYVLGDNRLQSSDSRRWGPLAEHFITGRAFLRAWPFSRFTAISEVEYSY
ncbi:MAG: Signal peptidase I [Candidatus Yanofskybacteria bacterium GW2011_GWA2_44_9]|uniref:Signal peptidase I n=2 Tax=Candidatus Yanofskyibacteriota TaxID=1752733 RepID=A0A0G1KF14_9BACT|nr:MAG: Signal peptidase I [Candidatus Yanofskybacteria bacterium GW2011_GWA2_44_9]